MSANNLSYTLGIESDDSGNFTRKINICVNTSEKQLNLLVKEDSSAFDSSSSLTFMELCEAVDIQYKLQSYNIPVISIDKNTKAEPQISKLSSSGGQNDTLADNVSEPVIDIVNSSVSEPVSEPVSDIVNSSVSEPVSEPVSAPVSEPVVAPVSELSSSPIENQNNPADETISLSQPTQSDTNDQVLSTINSELDDRLQAFIQLVDKFRNHSEIYDYHIMVLKMSSSYTFLVECNRSHPPKLSGWEITE